MRISVIVPAFNEERVLERTLRSIRAAMAAFDRAGWEAELIVCDNNSTDRTAGIAKAMGAEVVFEPVNQISRARNTGASRARGDWLIFVDADSWPPVELFEDVVAVIRDRRVVAGGCTIRFDTRDLAPRIGIGWWNLISRVQRWAAGSFIFCEADAFRALGGFTLDRYAAEEIEFFQRLKRYARSHRRRIAILHDHPLVTSARKATLYAPREALAFMFKTIITRGRTLRNPDDCYQWYDGRR